LLSRLALHAFSLEIIDPTTNEKRYFEAPLPKDMDVVRKQCAKLFKVDPLG